VYEQRFKFHAARLVIAFGKLGAFLLKSTDDCENEVLET